MSAALEHAADVLERALREAGGPLGIPFDAATRYAQSVALLSIAASLETVAKAAYRQGL